MSTPASIPAKPELFDQYVRKFRSICEMHGIQFGSVGNLPDFIHRLADDRYFAMDFWAFTGRLSSREDGNLSDEQMLALVVEGIAGDEVLDAEGELKSVLAELAALLAGIDVQSPLPDPREPAPFPHIEADSNAREETTQDGSEIPWRPFSLRAVFLPDAIDGEAGTGTSAPYTPSTQLEDTLRRLQASNLELKRQLDQIDRKMSRFEPPAEELTPQDTAKEQVRTSAQPAAIPTVEMFARNPGRRTRLGRQPDPSPAAGEPPTPELFASLFGTETKKEDKKRREDNDEWNPIPLELYAEQRGPRGIPLFVVLVLLVAGGTFFLQRYGAPLQKRYGPGIQRVQRAIGDRLGLNSRNETKASETTASSESVASNGTESAASRKFSNRPAARGFSSARVPAAASNNASDQANAMRSGAPQAAEAKPDLSTSREATISRSQSQAEEAALADRADRRMAAPDASGPEDATLVNVAPAVMEANLVLSRVPAYPELARTDRVQGPVVVKAIISKAGTVQDVQVLQGDPLLRNAAAEAIYKWRYRPYLLNGQPVEVATTITVDFKLSR
jgi:TonB family protein